MTHLVATHVLEYPYTRSVGPVVGRFLVFARKAVFHLFLKWFSRPVLEQQNLYNQTVSRLLQELLQAQERSERRH